MTQTILLASGKSTRTWPITEKVFFEIGGKTLLQHQIETMLAAGLQKIVVVGNENNIQVIKTICRELPGQFSFSVQKDLSTGIRGGILAAKSSVNEKEPILLVCSNDIVEKSAFETIKKKAKSSDSQIFLVGKKVEKYFPGGYLELFCGKNSSSNTRIKKLVEKPGEGNEPSSLVTLLIHFFQKGDLLLRALEKQKTGDYYEEVLQSLFDIGVTAEVVEYTGFWSAIKYPWHFLDVAQFFRERIQETKIHPTAYIAKGACIGERAVIGKNTKVLDGAIVVGPSIIGENVVIANHTLVRESVIERGCVIGQGTEVARSILQKNCWTHQNFIGDSVFEENVPLGAGTKTGNLRLEEGEVFSEIHGQKVSSQRKKLGLIAGKDIRVGVNTSFMPGVKIGSGSFLGGGLIIDHDISENRFVRGKIELIERENKFSSPSRERF